jgi:uncharacterized protein (DUF4415 family)
MPESNHQIAEPPQLESAGLESEASVWDGSDILWPKPKERVTVRFDQDVLEFFRREGRGYQTRMNAVLRAYIRADLRRK